MIIPILTQTPFNYSYLASSATEEVIVADNIPVTGARTVALSVRVHRITTSAGASFRFLIYGVDPSRTDGTVFITSAAIGDTGAAIATGMTTNLVGLSSIISDPIYPFVRVVLRATGPASTGTTYAEMSADLVVREASAGPSARSASQAAFAEDLLLALYDEAPRSNGTLSEFTPRPQNLPTCLPSVLGSVYCSKSLSCGGGPKPQPPGTISPSESWICKVLENGSKLWHCK